MSRALRFVIAAAMLFAASSASAYDWGDGFNFSKKDGDQYFMILSPYTQHYYPSDNHNHVWLVGVDRERSDGSLAGAAFFSNSFGQPSVYLYPWGQTYRNVLDRSELYVKWTAGLLYGYREPYEDKVPLNYKGFSPGFVPAVGWEFENRYQVQLNFLGFNGAMLQFSLPVR